MASTYYSSCTRFANWTIFNTQLTTFTQLYRLISTLQFKAYRLSIFGASAFRISMSVLPFLPPLMLQIGCHLNAFSSGMYLLSLFAGNAGMKAFIVPMLRLVGFRRISS